MDQTKMMKNQKIKKKKKKLTNCFKIYSHHYKT